MSLLYKVFRVAMTPDIPLFFVLLLSSLGAKAGSSIGIDEFCQTEKFTASCDDNNVIMMTHARYGRMKLSHCVKKDYGYIGCSSDILRLADLKCSGRTSCEVAIPDNLFDTSQPCPDDLKAYLEASYVCIPVARAQSEFCKSSGYVKITNDHGYISSMEARAHGCGTSTSPWTIEVAVGQRLNITLHDFSEASVANTLPATYSQRTKQFLEPSCRELAVIAENHKEERLSNCYSSQRSTSVYVSRGNILEVSVVPGPQEDAHFLLEYTAFGCVDPKAPKGGWFKRNNDVVQVGCEGSDKVMSTHSCLDGRWVGNAVNCSSTVTETSGRISRWNINIPNELSVALVIAIALAIGLVILALGLLYLKKRGESNSEQCPPSNRQELIYQSGHLLREGCHTPMGKERFVTVPKDPRRHRYPDDNDYALIWEVQHRALNDPLNRASGHMVPPVTKLPASPCIAKSIPGTTSISSPSHKHTLPPGGGIDLTANTNTARNTCPIEHSISIDEGVKYFELDPNSKGCRPT